MTSPPEKRRRQTDSDGTTPTATAYKTIFIDTSLNTHIAMIISDSDTVSILKEKMLSEHALCFPETGAIKINFVKVKRKGYFYHLPDYMLVKSAFEGVKKSWFLYADISSFKKANNASAINGSPADSHSSLLIKDQGVAEDTAVSIHRLRQLDSPSKTRNVENDKLKEVTTPSEKQGEVKACRNLSQKNRNKRRRLKKDAELKNGSVGTGLPAKDQVDVGYVGDTAASDDKLEEAGALHNAPESLDHVPVVPDPGNRTQAHAGSTVKKAKKAAGNQGSIAKNIPNLPIKDQGLGEETAASIERNQNNAADGNSSLPMKNRVAVGCVGDVTAYTDRLEEADTSYKAPESLVRVPLVLDSSGKAQEDVGTTFKKAINASAINGSPADSHSNLSIKDQDTRNTGDDKLKEVNTPSKKQGEVKACANKSPKIQKKAKKSIKKGEVNQDSVATGHSTLPAKDQVGFGYEGDTAASDDKLEEAGTFYKAPESLDHLPVVPDPSNKTQEHSGGTAKKAIAGNQGPAAKSLSNFPIEDQGVSEEAAASIQRLREPDSSSRTRTARKHRQNQLAVSESMYQKSSSENNVEGPERSSENNVEGPELNLSEVAKCEGQEINFKQYFVPGQHQSEAFIKLTGEAVAEKKVEESGVPSVGTLGSQQDMRKSCKNLGSITSAGELKNATKSSMGMEIKMDKLGRPHAPASSNLKQIKDLQKPVARAVSNGSDTNRSVPAHIKQNDENPCGGSSSSSSSESSEKIPVKKIDKRESGRRRSERISTRHSSLLREKSLLRMTRSMVKDVSDERGGSSSECSGRTPLKKVDKKESGLRRHPVTNERNSSKVSGKVLNILKREKSLLRTPVPISKDVSDESSGDENGHVNSNTSTRTPSDKSSSSGYSSDGSDHSEDSTKNGAHGVEGKGGGTKKILKPDVSGTQQITMDMVFRSSSRFKKAKLTASQQLDETEMQPIDFVL